MPGWIVWLLPILFVSTVSQASETVKGARKDYETFRKEMTVRLESVEKQLAELKEKAKEKSGDTQAETVKQLEATRAQLRSQLESWQSEGRRGWRRFKKKFAESMDRLNSRVQDALADE